MDADVLAAQGFFQSGAAAQVGADNLHPGGQMVAAGQSKTDVARHFGVARVMQVTRAPAATSWGSR